jgi:hypothetical protein
MLFPEGFAGEQVFFMQDSFDEWYRWLRIYCTKYEISLTVKHEDDLPLKDWPHWEKDYDLLNDDLRYHISNIFDTYGIDVIPEMDEPDPENDEVKFKLYGTSLFQDALTRDEVLKAQECMQSIFKPGEGEFRMLSRRSDYPRRVGSFKIPPYIIESFEVSQNADDQEEEVTWPFINLELPPPVNPPAQFRVNPKRLRKERELRNC